MAKGIPIFANLDLAKARKYKKMLGGARMGRIYIRKSKGSYSVFQRR